MKHLLISSLFLLFLSISGNSVSQSITVTLQPDSGCAKDALISLRPPEDSQNHGRFAEFNALAWTNIGAPAVHRSLLEFDLSFIPSGSVVQSAYLTLYFNPTVSNGNTHSTMSGPNDAYIKKIINPWDEYTVTWNNQPATSDVNKVYLSASSSGTEDYSLDVTSLVSDYVNDPSHNFGMMLGLVNENAYRRLLFASSDNSNPLLNPKLVVTYLPAANACLEFQYASCNGVDALISKRNPETSQNHGDFPEFNALAWTNSGDTAVHRSLIYWDLQSIPSNAVINSAYVNLYFSPSTSNGTSHSSMSGPNDAYFQVVTSPWNEYLVSWANQPSTTTLNQVHLASNNGTTQDYKNLDVKKIVEDWVKNPSTNYGLMLRLATEKYYRRLLFGSSDVADQSKHPLINICYTIPNGMEEIELPNVRIFPNPFFRQLTIGYDQIESSNLNISIYDIRGAKITEIYNGRTSRGSYSFNYFPEKELSPGIYFLHFLSEKESKIVKVVYNPMD